MVMGTGHMGTWVRADRAIRMLPTTARSAMRTIPPDCRGQIASINVGAVPVIPCMNSLQFVRKSVVDC